MLGQLGDATMLEQVLRDVRDAHKQAYEALGKLFGRFDDWRYSGWVMSGVFVVAVLMVFVPVLFSSILRLLFPGVFR